MDFPINLNRNFIVGIDEFKQTLTLLFQNSIRTFLQNKDIGSLIPEHSGSADLVEVGAIKTVEQIPGLSMERIEVNLPRVDCTVKYKEEIINFTFAVNEE